MTAVIAIRIGLISLLLIFSITLPKLSFSLDVPTDLESDTTDILQQETALGSVEEQKTADVIEEGSSTLEEAASTVEESAIADAASIEEETASAVEESIATDADPGTKEEVSNLKEGTTGNVEEEIAGTIEETTSTVEETPDITSLAAGTVEGTVDTVEGTVDTVEGTVDTVEETADIASLDESADNLEDLAAGTVEATTSTVEEETSGIITREERNNQELEDSLLSSSASRFEAIPIAAEGYEDVKIISNPQLTEKEKQQIVEKALNVQGLEEWSPEGGWKVVGMDFIGDVEPVPQWEKAIVYLHLPNDAGNPPIDCQQGWDAVIGISLDVGKVTDAGFPTISSHECRSAIILEEPDKPTRGVDHSSKQENRVGAVQENNASLSPSSPPVSPSFVIAETDDVISNDIYGTAAHLNTPLYNSSIFTGMDSYMAFLVNQKWLTSPLQHMTQIGWLVTSIEGCVDCGSQHIGENSTALVFTDSSVFGNLEAHGIPFFHWKNNEDLVAGTWCNEDGNYTIWAQYEGRVFNHNTNISCENPDNDSKVSNSIFFENWNTAESSSWADQMLGKVEAHSAIAFRLGWGNDVDNIQSWKNSTNEEQDCKGSRELTKTIEGNLILGKTANWMNLSDIPSAC